MMIISAIVDTDMGYIQLSVLKYTGKMQAEIMGTKFVLNSVRINPVNAKHIQT